MGIDKKKLSYLEYVNREKAYIHPTYSEDILQYVYLKNGDDRALDEAKRNFNPEIQGKISDDDLRNIKYLFVAATTLACRYAIEGGADHKMAFNASDLYIRQMDDMSNITDVIMLHSEMISYYLTEVKLQQTKDIYSLPVIKSIDYIYNHLNEKLNVKDIASIVNLHPNYLSSLFKNETGINIVDFIAKERIKTACNMLKYTQYSLSDISFTLNFSSQSYFISVFRKEMGVTPKEYRNHNSAI